MSRQAPIRSTLVAQNRRDSWCPAPSPPGFTDLAAKLTSRHKLIKAIASEFSRSAKVRLSGRKPVPVSGAPSTAIATRTHHSLA